MCICVSVCLYVSLYVCVSLSVCLYQSGHNFSSHSLDMEIPRWQSCKKTNKQTKHHLPMQEMQETLIWSLGWEDPLEEEMATHSSILTWRIPWTEEPGRLQSMGLQSRTRLKWLSTTHTWTWRCKGHQDQLDRGMSVWVRAEPCLTLCNHMDYSPPGSSVHGIYSVISLLSITKRKRKHVVKRTDAHRSFTVMAPNRKQSKRPIDEWMYKSQHIHRMV